MVYKGFRTYKTWYHIKSLVKNSLVEHTVKAKQYHKFNISLIQKIGFANDMTKLAILKQMSICFISSLISYSFSSLILASHLFYLFFIFLFAKWYAYFFLFLAQNLSLLCGRFWRLTFVFYFNCDAYESPSFYEFNRICSF